MYRYITQIAFRTVIILLLLPVFGCKSIASDKYVGAVYSVVLIDQDSQDKIIGQTIHEYGRITNSVITDTSGKATLSFIGIIPVISLTGYYEPIHLLVSPSQTGVDTINVGDKEYRNSKKVEHKAVRSLNRSKAKFSPQDIWVVDTILVHLNSAKERYEQHEPGFREKRLRSLLPRNIDQGYTLRFDGRKGMLINHDVGYTYDPKGEYFSLNDKDAVYLFNWYLIDSETLVWIRDDEYGSIEYRLNSEE